MEITLQGKASFVPRGNPKAHNSEDMVDDNQDRESVSETSYPSEENSTTLTPSFRTIR